MRTAIGVVAFDEVSEIARDEIDDAQARRAGAASRAELLEWLDGHEGTLYRIVLRLDGPDPRVALRERDTLDEEEVADLRARLARFDGAAANGPWTERLLRLLGSARGCAPATWRRSSTAPRSASRPTCAS